MARHVAPPPVHLIRQLETKESADLNDDYITTNVVKSQNRTLDDNSEKSPNILDMALDS
jgi:hypothetical protein